MLGLILIVVLVLILLGGISGWPRGPWYGAPADHGPYYGGGIGIILLILIVLFLFGRI